MNDRLLILAAAAVLLVLYRRTQTVNAPVASTQTVQASQGHTWQYVDLQGNSRLVTF